LLKMDFRNFFPSILMTDIVRHLEIHCGQQYDSSAIKLIAYVCTWAPKRQGPLRLCIGAPSSPLLSNSVMFDFDKQLSSAAASDRVTYTRYADDLALSSRTSGINNLPRSRGEAGWESELSTTGTEREEDRLRVSCREEE
jgi:RNA-directed DNA polymerase